MSEFTPGPWRVGYAGTTVFGAPNGSPCPTVIAIDLTRANARLIASGPNLLRACQLALQYVVGPADIRMNDTEMEETLKQAIAQAEGEPHVTNPA